MKTRTVAKYLSTKTYTLAYLLQNDLIPHPPKDVSGDYIWGEEHVEAAREALARRQKKQAVPA